MRTLFDLGAKDSMGHTTEEIGNSGIYTVLGVEPCYRHIISLQSSSSTFLFKFKRSTCLMSARLVVSKQGTNLVKPLKEGRRQRYPTSF